MNLKLEQMGAKDPTRFAKHLASAQMCSSVSELARHWHDLEVVLRLTNAAVANKPEFGSHVRRSFLGALGPGASPAARSGAPCTWEPPCALDLFCREQLRGPRGDGLPKPFAIQLSSDEDDLLVGLTVFGMACDWFYVAAEAMSAGLIGILPWAKATQGSVPETPHIFDRSVSGVSGLGPNPEATSLRVDFLSPVDASSRKPVTPATLLSSALRRLDAVSRWQGFALDPDAGRAAASEIHAATYQNVSLKSSGFDSPNRSNQTRHSKVLTGSFEVSGQMEILWPLLSWAERAQIGRGTVQGLGRLKVGPLENRG